MLCVMKNIAGFGTSVLVIYIDFQAFVLLGASVAEYNLGNCSDDLVAGLL
jgi:hypothetical protein